MQRRDFLKLSATAGAVSCITACGGKSGESVTPPTAPETPERYSWTACSGNCHTNCPLQVVSKDGRITRIEPISPEMVPEGALVPRPCPKGYTGQQRVYSPDRLLYPMKRVPGTKRGEGQWERISWDQAATEIVEKLQELRNRPDAGPRSIFMPFPAGASSSLAGFSYMRLLNAMGGATFSHSAYSNAQHDYACQATYGGDFYIADISNVSSEMKNSDFILGFGYNPEESCMGGGSAGAAFRREKVGKPFISFDPRFTDSVLSGRGEHHPIYPGTDTALVEAIIHVLLTDPDNQGLSVAETFLREKCYGFYPEAAIPDRGNEGQMLPEVTAEQCYRDYILGTFDNTPKTPERASTITGVPVDVIKDVAKRLYEADAPYICSGWGSQRNIIGDDWMRAQFTLCCALGAIGRRGTSVGGLPMYSIRTYNAVLPMGFEYITQPPVQLPLYNWARAIEHGETMSNNSDFVKGLPTDDDVLGVNLKAVFVGAANVLMNQDHGTMDKVRLLQDESKLELIVTADLHMTSSAQYSDYLLPVSSWYERDDYINTYGSAQGTVIPMFNLIEPLAETKDDWSIALLLAQKAGVEANFTEGKTRAEWLEEVYQTSGKVQLETYESSSDVPQTFEELKASGPQTFRLPFADNDDKESGRINAGHAVFDWVSDNKPLNTPSGRIEIYSVFNARRDAAARAQGLVPADWLDQDNYINAIPKYTVCHGMRDDKSPINDDYPLQMLGIHAKNHFHSQNVNIRWLEESMEECVWVNPQDVTNFKDGDTVIVESVYGKVRIPARVTNRIVPGVASMPQGGWFNLVDGVDVGHCMNTLNSYEHRTPGAKNAAMNGQRVKIYKA